MPYRLIFVINKFSLLRMKARTSQIIHTLCSQHRGPRLDLWLGN